MLSYSQITVMQLTDMQGVAMCGINKGSYNEVATGYIYQRAGSLVCDYSLYT